MQLLHKKSYESIISFIVFDDLVNRNSFSEMLNTINYLSIYFTLDSEIQ